MKTWIKQNSARRRAFTLIELLVVIFIIAVLAGLVLGAVVGAKGRAKKVMAKTEMASLKGAILMYEKDYSIYPTTNSVDTCYGADPVVAGSPPNSDVLDVLRNVDPNARDNPQKGHPRNPRRVAYMEIKPASTPSSPGITASGTYNDPWGNPYIITLDNDFNDVADDVVYNSPTTRSQTIRNSVMIWSRGPDGKANTDPSHDDNKDNVLGWK